LTEPPMVLKWARAFGLLWHALQVAVKGVLTRSCELGRLLRSASTLVTLLPTPAAVCRVMAGSVTTPAVVEVAGVLVVTWVLDCAAAGMVV